MLDQFADHRAALLGRGGEANAYGLDEDPGAADLPLLPRGAPQRVIAQIQGLYRLWADAPFEIPTVLENGERAGRIYTVTSRLAGESLDRWLPPGADRSRGHGTTGLPRRRPSGRRPCPRRCPGSLDWSGRTRHGSSGRSTELLNAQLEPQIEVSRDRLDADYRRCRTIWQQLFVGAVRAVGRPAVVHGDYCPANTYVRIDTDGRPRMTGVGDFSPHTLVADPRWMWPVR